MRIGYNQEYAYASDCYAVAVQGLAVTVVKLDQIVHDPEAFQKTCIAIQALIQGINFYFHTHYLPRLITTLEVAQSFDFYGFCRLPRYFLCPYQAERLDEYQILDQLESLLCENWQLGIADHKGHLRDPEVYQFAKEQLTAFLEFMAETGQDYSTEEEVQGVLKNWLSQELIRQPQPDFNDSLIDLKDLHIPFKPNSWLTALIDGIFVAIDILCIFTFLQEWSVIDLSHYVRRLGSFKTATLSTYEYLDEVVKELMCAGFLLQFMQAFYVLMMTDLKPAEKRDTQWLMAASLAEFFYNYAILRKLDPRWVAFLAFTAKSLGLLRFLLTPKPTFFDDI